MYFRNSLIKDLEPKQLRIIFKLGKRLLFCVCLQIQMVAKQSTHVVFVFVDIFFENQFGRSAIRFVLMINRSSWSRCDCLYLIPCSLLLKWASRKWMFANDVVVRMRLMESNFDWFSLMFLLRTPKEKTCHNTPKRLQEKFQVLTKKTFKN